MNLRIILLAKMNLIVVTSLLTFLAHAGAFAPSPNRVPAKCAPLKMGLLSRFRKKEVIKVDPIKIGAPLPEVDVQVISDGEIDPVSIKEVLGDGTAVLVGMPGAFTTTCSTEHLPGYINNAEKLFELGVDKICVITTNDKFVNGAWAKDAGLDLEEESCPVTILADGDAELVTEIGMVEDMGFGVGVRSKRFVLMLNDGVASYIQTDDGMEDCINTSAEALVKYLTPPEPEVEDEVEMVGATLAVLGVGALVVASTMFHGDGESTASTVKALAPVMKKEAVDSGFTLLQQYR